MIRVSSPSRQTFLHLSIVYGRDQEYPNQPFLESIRSNLTTHRLVFPEYTVRRLNTIWQSRSELTHYVVALEQERKCALLLAEKDWNGVIEIVQDCRVVWNALLGETKRETANPWGDRFTDGWVLTRIMHLGVHAYFRLKMYPLQAELLEALLNQNVHCVGKFAKHGSRFSKKRIMV